MKKLAITSGGVEHSQAGQALPANKQPSGLYTLAIFTNILSLRDV